MQKTLIIIAVLALVFTLASCGSSGGGGSVVGAVPPITEPMQQLDRVAEPPDVEKILSNPEPVFEIPINHDHDWLGVPLGTHVYLPADDASKAVFDKITADFVEPDGIFDTGETYIKFDINMIDGTFAGELDERNSRGIGLYERVDGRFQGSAVTGTFGSHRGWVTGFKGEIQ